MARELLMGNAAIGLGAIKAGVNLVSGYPGTPSTEILETIARENPGDIYVEWSVNEKTALEVAAGASYTGARSMVTMKQVGLNVASDPLMSLNYLSVKGGMVVVVADDPGPISSQTEQDTRHFGEYAKIPVFDPSSPEEAYEMIQDAFSWSERFHRPVIFRPTTRVCHACADIDTSGQRYQNRPEGFVKDSGKWVIFPRTAYLNHLKLEEQKETLSEEFSSYRFNTFTGKGRLGIAAGGVSYQYAQEVLSSLPAGTPYSLLKIATPTPFPEKLGLEFLNGVTDVLCLEELDPVIETNLLLLCGKHHLPVNIHGKLDGTVSKAGENSVEAIAQSIYQFLQIRRPETSAPREAPPSLPIRPPVLCAGCPHRASFYAVKQAMKGKKAVFSGDIGCYTLGNAQPLDMVDTCLCMGADVTVAQGLHRMEPDAVNFSFIGDSTFFHTGIPGVINAVYNQTEIKLMVLDNSTTAMTGSQPHPGTGQTMMGEISEKVSIEAVLKAIGVQFVETCSPFDLAKAQEAVKRAAEHKGVAAVIFRAPCITVSKPLPLLTVNSHKCTGCKRCIKELGCPAISYSGHKAVIEPSMCYGCTICAQVCPFGAIEEEAAMNKSILLAGVGGQGTVLASKLIAQAAIDLGFPARTAETIGMAQRGGCVVSHVRIGEAHSPLIPKGKADIIIGFEPAEAVRCLPYLKDEGAVVTTKKAIKPVTASLSGSSYDGTEMIDYLTRNQERFVVVDGEKICAACGSAKVLNIALLGAACAAGALGIPRKSFQKAIESRLPQKFVTMNLKALELGAQEVK